MAKSTDKEETTSKARRSTLKQTDVPSCSLEEALRIPKAIADNYASDPTSALKVAEALDMKPSSGGFRMLCGASIAYGLTIGGYNAPDITITELAKRILKPLTEGDDHAAKCEALLIPRVTREFLTKYQGAKLPKPNIAENVLEELGVPRDRASGVFEQIVNSASALGMMRTIKNDQYIDIKDISSPQESGVEESDSSEFAATQGAHGKPPIEEAPPAVGSDATQNKATLKRVFITHGKNKAYVEPIKQLLAFGDLEPVVSVERESVSKPVPDKVMDDMRSCGAAIIHVDAETKVMDNQGDQLAILNENVLIEIGASMALYGRRFILLVRQGVTLPSNLQGLYQVRYDGEELGSDATIRLMKAINEIKNVALPE